MKSKLTFIFSILILFSCNTNSKSTVPAKEWIRTATIYELIPYKFSEAKSLQGVIDNINHFRKLNANTVSLISMLKHEDPGNNFNPGNVNSVSDHYSINPRYGDVKEVIRFIDTLHHTHMRVLLEMDMTLTHPLHTWRKEKPDYYLSSEAMVNNNFNPDYVKLNLSNVNVQKEWIKILEHWMSTLPIDGFILRSTETAPDAFLEDIIKAVSSDPSRVCIIDKCTEGSKSIPAFHGEINHDLYAQFLKMNNDSVDMSFFQKMIDQSKSENFFFVNYSHDLHIDEYEATVPQRFYSNHRALAVLCNFLPGVPIMLNGQEEPLYERINTFNTTPIKMPFLFDLVFYRAMFIHRYSNKSVQAVRKENEVSIVSSSPQVLCMLRKTGDHQDLILVNLSTKAATFHIDTNFPKCYELFTTVLQEFDTATEYKLYPFQFLVLTNKF
ncbi:MAG: hypothetical protein K1X49_00085 [Saprospiraceae bacterium]|nr:hypothetical protein [Saprospiraceae bacterium]